jgi:hypothetical protein
MAEEVAQLARVSRVVVQQTRAVEAADVRVLGRPDGPILAAAAAAGVLDKQGDPPGDRRPAGRVGTATHRPGEVQPLDRLGHRPAARRLQRRHHVLSVGRCGNAGRHNCGRRAHGSRAGCDGGGLRAGDTGLLDVRWATVTADDAGCQADVARQAIEAGGDYVLTVKENQPRPHAKVKMLMDEAILPGMAGVHHGHDEEADSGYGRRRDPAGVGDGRGPVAG